MCEPGHEFEILTEGSQYVVLPPSIINGHHYQSIGKEKLTISAVEKEGSDKDKIYSFLIKNLEDCLIHDDSELSISNHLLQKGVSYIKYREPYSLVTVNGIEVPFRVFESWNDTAESIYQAFALIPDIVTSLTILLADEHRKRRRYKELELEVKDNIEAKPRYDINLVNIVSDVISRNHWYKSSEIWNRLIEKLKDGVDNNSYDNNSNTFHSSRFGTIYKNSTVPGILFQLGAQHKHTKTGGVWLLLSSSSSDSMRPTTGHTDEHTAFPVPAPVPVPVPISISSAAALSYSLPYSIPVSALSTLSVSFSFSDCGHLPGHEDMNLDSGLCIAMRRSWRDSEKQDMLIVISVFIPTYRMVNRRYLM